MNTPFINITIPVHNEERVVAANVEKVVNFLKSNFRYPYEIVVANNGSTDRTQALAEELSRCHSVIRVMHLSEPGRGRMIKKVWSESQAGILSYMDVDLSTDLNDFPKFIESLISGGFDVATGSRRLKGSVTARGFKREILSRGYLVLLKILFQTKVSDVQCGFKAITKNAACELLPLLEDHGWLMDTELLIMAERLGYRIMDMPVRWVEDTDSRVKIRRDFLAALKGLLRLRRKLAAGKYRQRFPVS